MSSPIFLVKNSEVNYLSFELINLIILV